MATRQTGNPYNAGIDANNYPTLTALSGTAGTADTAGTAEIIAIGGNPTTGALYVQDLSGVSGTTTVQMVSGTLNVGTVVVSSSSGGTNVNVISGTLLNTGTTVNVATGTINLGTVAISNTPTVNMAGGTLNVGTTTVSGNVGVSSGTINVGTFTNLGTNVNIVTGSLVGTVLGGTLQNLATGTITSVANLVGGTLSVGTVVGQQANAGSLTTNPIPIAGTTSAGTLYGMLVDTSGNPQVDVVNTPTINVASGTQQTLGTVGTLNGIAAGDNNIGNVDIVTGTITRVSNVGTLESGTVQKSSLPVQIGTSYGTLGTAGALTWGTLIAASGAGTYQYVSGLSIVVQSGTVDVAITNVGTVATIGGAGILARGNFAAGAGITKTFDPVMRSGTNGTLGYYLGGAGSVWFDVQYWQGV